MRNIAQITIAVLVVLLAVVGTGLWLFAPNDATIPWTVITISIPLLGGGIFAVVAFGSRIAMKLTEPKTRARDVQIVRFYRDGVPLFKAVRYGIGSAMWEHPDTAYRKRWRDIEGIKPSIDLLTIQARVDAWRDDTGQNDEVVGYV